jgi:hypothetical protein
MVRCIGKGDAPAPRLQCILSGRPPTIGQNVLGEQTVRLGFHVDWTGVWVNIVQMLQLRELCVQQLNDDFPPQFEVKYWDCSVDIQVFNKPHPCKRMNGFIKGSRCTECVRGYGMYCANIACCDGRVYDNLNVYTVWAVLDAEGTLDTIETSRVQSDMVSVVTMTSIRTEHQLPCPWFSIPADAPPLYVTPENHRVYRKHGLASGTRCYPSATADQHFQPFDALPGTRTEIMRILGVCNPNWRQLRIEAIYHTHTMPLADTRPTKRQKRDEYASPAAITSSTYTVKVRGMGSRYCLNKGGGHTSNTIYFTITKAGMFQKCWSRNRKQYNGGHCATFRAALNVDSMVKLHSDLFDIHA